MKSICIQEKSCRHNLQTLSGKNFCSLLLEQHASSFIPYHSKYYHKKSREEKKKQRRLEYDELILNRPADWKSPISSSLFLRFGAQQMNANINFRLANAMQHGPHFVVDMDYENYMRKQELTSLFDQLRHIQGANKLSPSPFHLIYSNLRTSSYENFLRVYSNPDDQLYTLTSKSFLDLFPKERLVYLTPDCRETLQRYNDDDVYIVGGYNDKSDSKPVSYSRAKQLNLRMAKLPLERHIKWIQGSKNLTLDQCFTIISDIKDGFSMRESILKRVPSRKFITLEEAAVEERSKRDRFKSKSWKPWWEAKEGSRSGFDGAGGKKHGRARDTRYGDDRQGYREKKYRVDR